MGVRGLFMKVGQRDYVSRKTHFKKDLVIFHFLY